MNETGVQTQAACRARVAAGADSVFDKAYVPAPVSPAPSAAVVWLGCAAVLAGLVTGGVFLQAFRAESLAPTSLTEDGARLASLTPISAPAARRDAADRSDDGLVPFDPSITVSAEPAPTLAGAGSATLPEPPAPQPSGSPAPIAPSSWGSSAFRPSQRLQGMKNFMRWGPAQAIPQLAAAGPIGTPNPYEGSADAEAPMATLRAALLRQSAPEAKPVAQPAVGGPNCDSCRDAMGSSHLFRATRRGFGTPLKAASLTYLGRCGEEYLYSVQNLESETQDINVHESRTGQVWNLSQVRSGESRTIRSAIPISLP